MPVLALVLVTAVWGITFVQVKDAVALYPLFAFLAIRFAIASLTLAGPAARRVRSLGRRGVAEAAFLGLLLGTGYVLQTAGLERTTVSGTGFITGMYVVLTPLIALLLFRTHTPAAAWCGVGVSVVGLALLSGVHAGSAVGDLMVLAASAVYSLQIVLLERYAPLYDPLALTFIEMVVAVVGIGAVAAALGEFDTAPTGWTVWGALIVTGVFASALAYLIQTWAQQRTSATRTALVFTLEPVFTGIFGFALAGDRLGLAGWGGCALILAGILLAEPAAAGVLVRLVGRPART